MATITWLGGHGNHWSTAKDWTGDQVPQAGDDVVVGAGVVIDVDIAATVADVALGAGSVLNVAAPLDISGTLDGGTVRLNGNAVDVGTLDGVKWIGALSIANGSTVYVEGGLSVVAPGGGGGTIDLQASYADTELWIGDSETLNNSTIEGNGIIEVNGATLTLGKHETVFSAAGGGNIDFSCYNGVTSTTVDTQGLIVDDDLVGYGFGYSNNSGTIQIGPGATDLLFEETFTNTGLIEAAGGGTGTFTTYYYGNFSGSDVTNYTAATEALAGGTWEAASGSTLDLQLAGGIASDNATTVLDGPAAAIQVWDSADSAYQPLAATVTALGGMLDLLDGANWITANQLAVTGMVELGGGTLSAAGGLDLTGGTVAGNGTLGQAGDSPVVLNGGKIEAQNGLLDVAAPVTGPGVLLVDAGATLDLSSTLTNSTVRLNGGSADFANTATLDGVKWIGALSIANGSTVYVEGGLSVVAPGGGGGTIDLQASYADTELWIGDSETLNNSTIEGNGIIEVNGATLTLGKHETVFSAAGGGNIDFSCYNGVTSTTVDTQGLIVDDDLVGYGFGYSNNSGTIQIGPGATDLLFEETFTNTGLIEAAGGGTGTFTTYYYGNFSGSDVTNYTAATEALAGGTWEAASGSTLDLQLAGGIASDNATTVLDGPAAAIQVWDSADSAYQPLAATVTALGGMLDLLDGANWITANQLAVTGMVELGGGTLSAAGGLDLTGGTVAGNGTLGQAGDSPVVLNGGKIEAQNGLLDVAAPVTGPGALLVEPGATLELAAAAEWVTYIGVATLNLDNPALFGGGLKGVTAGDTLVLGGISADSVLLSGGKLTVELSGGGKERFSVSGTATGATFVESGGNTVVSFNGGVLLDAVGPSNGIADSLGGAGHPFG